MTRSHIGGVPGRAEAPAAVPGPRLAACRGQRGQATFDTPVAAAVAVRMEGVRSEQREGNRRRGAEGSWTSDEEGVLVLHNGLLWRSQRDERAPRVSERTAHYDCYF